MRKAAPFAALVSASILVACSSPDRSPAPQAPQVDRSKVLAVVGDEVITIDDFNARMNEQAPFVRSRYQSLEKKQEFLDNLIRMELLAQEAERRGYADDPEVRQAMKRMMVNKVIRTEHERDDLDDISDEEVRAYYEENINDFVKPERVRLSHIFFEAPRSDANRARVRGEATRLLAEIRAKEAANDRTAFANAARERSDDPISKRAGGDLAFRTKEELENLFGLEMAEASFSLENTGDLSQVVETERGFHLVKLVGRQRALDRSLEEVTPEIRGRLSRNKRNQRFEALVESLREQTTIETNIDVLDALEIEIPARQAPPQMGGAGQQRALPVQAERD